MGIDGKLAIRPLTEEEFSFLEKFNDEFVEGNFERDTDGNITENNLHYNLVNGTEGVIVDLKAQIKEVAAKLNETNGYREMNDRKAYWKYKKNLYKQHEKLKEQLEDLDLVGNTNRYKYARRFDLMAFVGVDERTVLITDNFPHLKYVTDEEELFEYVESTKL